VRPPGGYQLLRALPEPLDTSLPSVEQSEEELNASLNDEKPDK